MKYIEKLSVRIIIALVVGFLFASAFTSISYACEPIDGAVGCLSFQDAIMHPQDLLSNKQDSLVRFSSSFAVTGLVVFGLLTVLGLAYKRKSVQ